MPLLNPIPIVVVTDEHYLVLLAVLLKSIEVNHKTGEKIHVYIVEDGVKQSSQKKLQKSVSADMFTLTWVRMKDTITPGVKLPTDRTSFPLTTYMRLFIPNIVPPGTKKALFLDVDMMMLGEISELWHTALGEHAIAAVQDPRLLTFGNEWGGVFNYKELGLAADTKYFNSGMLLINIPKWIALNLTQRVIDCIAVNIKYANYADQYGLNVILADQWLELDGRWNYFASDDLKTPYLVHFISRKPIYKTYNNNPYYKELFDQYRKRTLWHNARPIGEMHRYIKKVNNILDKIKKGILN